MLKILTGLFFIVATATGALAQSSYAICSGDVLSIEVLEDASLNRSVLVLPDGSISFPLVGTVQAAGRSVADVRSALITGLTPNFAAAPNVYVSVAQLGERRASGNGTAAVKTTDIYAMGEVLKPGKIDAARGVTILQALAQAGGFTKFAATKRIELHRTDANGGEQILYFNYRGGGGISGSTRLQAGDVLVVPERRLFE
jgi:polysaccharide export outer membrane protein